MSNRNAQKRNFVLIELGDNDFSTAMHDALTQMHQSFDLESMNLERMNNYLVQHMVGHTIISHAQTNSKINWEKVQRTESYLTKRLRVSTPKKIDFTVDYDSGAVYLDIKLGSVWYLNSSMYTPD
ncbi:hypothetical protein OTK49_21110 [Vibrio coralliirubri]|uniref:hypothetical protein n=1 Tax=Vibrio coralliirubri TaxID=1516159 RepID=UPI002283DBE0|nr:hypothetical protein [Vibrio coralliirubri]MCY9865020.1 hypothetical protein [Vibrio coralliirubri]